MEGKVPVTVITGFLGAGKTTLVNHILTAQHGKKIAVIENEFGEVGIDDGLVVKSKEEIFEMNNGCVCCTVRGDLIRTMQKILKRKDKFDSIVIETTGLADPAPVIQTFFIDDNLKKLCYLDSVLTVVDCKHVLLHLNEEKPEGVVNEAVQQIGYADKILLSKVDIVDKDEKDEVLYRIRQINKPATIIECIQGNVDVELLLGIKAFNFEKLIELDPEFTESKYVKVHDHDHDHDHGEEHCDDPEHCKDPHHHHHDHEHECHDKDCKDPHHHHHDHEHKHEHECHDKDCKDPHHHHDHEHEHEHECHDKDCKDPHHHHDHDHDHGHHHHHSHRHDDQVTSVGILAEGECDMEKVQEWLGTLVREKGADLYRTKGILAFRNSPHKHVFQGVHMLLQFQSSADGVFSPWGKDEKRVNKLVFIGKKLDREELNKGFKACLAE